MKNKLLWTLLFAFLFVLSLDFWRWQDEIQIALLGLPTWIWYFVVLQLLLSFCIYLFGRSFSKHKQP